MNNRYKRQTILPEFKPNGQNELENSNVVVIGAGGLGSPALMYLAAAGIGEISIIDDDKIDESNLQRQILYTTNDQGAAKVEIAKMQLEALNPNIKIISHKARLTTDNAEKLLTKHDIILDTTDNFETRYLVNDTSVKLNIPVIFGAITGWEGVVSTFNTNKNSPCYRCLYPKKPQADIRNCAEAGAIGPVAGIIGSLMALEAIKFLVNTPALKILSNKLFILDGRTGQTNCIPINKNPNCVCGDLFQQNK